MSTDYRNFLALSYEELEELNLQAKADRANRVAADEIREKRLKYLTDEKRIKAVTVLFSDLEGRLHLLDYDKKFLLGAYENLTFDGSSIRGFTAQKESDLRLGIDWSAFYWVPSDVFGNGKVLVFGNVIDKDGSPYSGDCAACSRPMPTSSSRRTTTPSTQPPRSRDSSLRGKDAEANYHLTGKFDFISSGGYYHSAARSAAPVHRHIGRSAARHGLPEREGPPRSRAQPVSRSTTATPKPWPRPTRFSFTSC
jgi:glutamine synthetase